MKKAQAEGSRTGHGLGAECDGMPIASRFGTSLPSAGPLTSQCGVGKRMHGARQLVRPQLRPCSRAAYGGRPKPYEHRTSTGGYRTEGWAMGLKDPADAVAISSQ